ncbi:protein L [Pseudoxanthomonas sp. PXM03]|uniref:protein L n=1 Tax=Pseudoxanthomonas sp. PXM03 TaxID=2769284 RepID=UPI00177CFC62|nr:protein L [Pseudoxanthomonas sp. PXM03]MBD9435741.1 protein L [Pseudoxanthomonas sp. PXM03]
MSWTISTSVIGEGDAAQKHWKDVYGPGEKVPVSGIYRCLGCRREIAANQRDPFPHQNHHQHGTDEGDIRWKLNIRANTAAKS